MHVCIYVYIYIFKARAPIPPGLNYERCTVGGRRFIGEHTFDELEKCYIKHDKPTKNKRNVLLGGWRRFVVSSFLLATTSSKFENKWDQHRHTWDQSGPGVGGRGYSKIKENMRM